jgi:hypothetical protein
MKTILSLLIILLSFRLDAQTLPEVIEPQLNVLYRFYPNLIQLKVSNDDYNDYILVNDSCEVLLYDKAGNRLAPNNFIVKVPRTLRMDSIHFRIFNRANMQEELTIFSFDVANPPIAIVYLDGIMEGGTCSRRPLKFVAKTHEEAPINMIFEIEYWTVEIGDKEVFGKDAKFDEYAYSVLEKFPSGTELKFRCRITDELEYSSYHEAKFYLE